MKGTKSATSLDASPGVSTETSAPPRDRVRRHLPLLLITILAAILIFANLGDQALWQDEAQTALVARTILSYGIPHGYDGKNFFSQESGAEYGPHYIWRWHTWLQFYVLVPFLAVLGSTTLAARLPFAIFGLATIVLLYFAALEMWQSRKAAIFAALSLTLSVPFLLLVRQCRYYSPSAFFALLSVFAYIRLLRSERRSWMLLVISGILLFHTFYLYYVTVFAGLFIHALVFHRNRLKDAMTATGAVVLVNIPWIVWLSGMAYGSRLSDGQRLEQLVIFSRLTAANIFSPYLLILPVLGAALYYLKTGKVQKVSRESVSSIALLAIITLVTVAVLSTTSPAPFFRYLAPVFPLAALAIGLVLDRARPLVGALALAALILWSPYVKMTKVSNGRPNDIVTYLYEIAHHYEGPVEGTVSYLKQHAKPGDIVLVTYEDLPIKYYTNLRVLGGLTGEDLRPAEKAEWIVARMHMASFQEKPVRQLAGLLVVSGRYFPTPIPYPDTQFENREDPYKHHWKTVDSEPRLVIYERR